MSRLDPRGEEFFTQSERGGGPIDPLTSFFEVYESLFFLTQDENNPPKNGKTQLLKCEKSFVLQNLDNYELYKFMKLFSKMFTDNENASTKSVEKVAKSGSTLKKEIASVPKESFEGGEKEDRFEDADEEMSKEANKQINNTAQKGKNSRVSLRSNCSLF